MKLKISHQLVKDPEGRIKHQQFHDGGRDHYHLGVWVDESSRILDKIEDCRISAQKGSGSVPFVGCEIQDGGSGSGILCDFAGQLMG